MTTITKRNEMSQRLADTGFQREPDGSYRRGDLTFDQDSGWIILTDSSRTDGVGPLERDPRATGPWKLIISSGQPFWIAEFPSTTLQVVSGLDEAEPAWLQCLDWAAETATGKAACLWEAPSESEVRSWISGTELTVQSHRHVRQVSLHRADHRLVLSVPIVAEIPAKLPKSRATWLRALLLATQERWRMVRVVVEGTGSQRTAVAEVDFSGAPRPILEALFTVGLQSLRYAVQWSVQSADLLVDLGVTCHALEVRQPTS